MKRVMFVGCGVFLCLSEISATHRDKAVGFSKWAAFIEQKVKYKLSSVDSEATLNGDVSVTDSSMVLHCGFNERRRRLKSEEFLSPIPCFDGQQSRGFNKGRGRTRSETINCKGSELNISDMLESNNQREERSRLIENENISCMLRISACQMSRFLGEDFFREFKDSHTYADKIKILTRGTVDYIDNCAKQNQELAKQNELLVRENGRQGERIKELEARTKIVSSMVSAEGKNSASVEKEKSAFHNQEINFGVPSVRIKKFEYIGDTAENMAHGKGMVSHIHGAFSITGTFFQNYLDLREKIVVRGSYGEKYKFMGNKNFGREAVISMDDISQVRDVYNIDLSTICLGLSNDDGKNEYILFNSDFVYQGELKGRDITGRGRMFRITGEIQEGEFEDGEYLCKK